MNPVYTIFPRFDQSILDNIISFTICPLAQDIKEIISILVCKRKIEEYHQKNMYHCLTIFTDSYYYSLNSLLDDYIERKGDVFLYLDNAL